MTIPLFTHQCGGCRGLMDLHPALRDFDLPAAGKRPASGAEPCVVPRGRSGSSRIRAASVGVACLALVVGLPVLF